MTFSPTLKGELRTTNLASSGSKKASPTIVEVKLSFNLLEIKGGYRFNGNSYEIFEQFFGSPNPFTDTVEFNNSDQYGSFFGDHFGGTSMKENPPPEDIIQTLGNSSIFPFKEKV